MFALARRNLTTLARRISHAPFVEIITNEDLKRQAGQALSDAQQLAHKGRPRDAQALLADKQADIKEFQNMTGTCIHLQEIYKQLTELRLSIHQNFGKKRPTTGRLTAAQIINKTSQNKQRLTAQHKTVDSNHTPTPTRSPTPI